MDWIILKNQIERLMNDQCCAVVCPALPFLTSFMPFRVTSFVCTVCWFSKESKAHLYRCLPASSQSSVTWFLATCWLVSSYSPRSDGWWNLQPDVKMEIANFSAQWNHKDLEITKAAVHYRSSMVVPFTPTPKHLRLSPAYRTFFFFHQYDVFDVIFLYVCNFL